MTNRHHHPRSEHHSARGFSLIELLIVITLIGVLMGVGIFALKGASEQVKKKATQARMELIENALTNYYVEYDGYPGNLDILLPATMVQGGQGYLEPDGTNDAWGRPLEFYAPFENFSWVIFSAGADGTFETTDDIAHYPSEENFTP